jgi:broad specificity phosphatase PhoE
VILGLRHAEVHNPGRVIYARLPGFHLSERGREDTERLARALVRAPLAGVYASPLDRAQETASILAGTHGLDVVSDDRLLEWSFWVRWQGLPWDRLRERHPELLDAYANDPATASPDDPLDRVGSGVLAWAVDAERAHGGGPVVGVTHEAPLVAALLEGSGAGFSRFHDVHLPHLGAVRLLPGSPETVDLIRALGAR